MEKMDSTVDDQLAPPAEPGDMLIVTEMSTLQGMQPGPYIIISSVSKEILTGMYLDYYDVLDREGVVRMVLWGNLRRGIADGGISVFTG